MAPVSKDYTREEIDVLFRKYIKKALVLSAVSDHDNSLSDALKKVALDVAELEAMLVPVRVGHEGARWVALLINLSIPFVQYIDPNGGLPRLNITQQLNKAYPWFSVDLHVSALFSGHMGVSDENSGVWLVEMLRSYTEQGMLCSLSARALIGVRNDHQVILSEKQDLNNCTSTSTSTNSSAEVETDFSQQATLFETLDQQFKFKKTPTEIFSFLIDEWAVFEGLLHTLSTDQQIKLYTTIINDSVEKLKDVNDVMKDVAIALLGPLYETRNSLNEKNSYEPIPSSNSDLLADVEALIAPYCGIGETKLPARRGEKPLPKLPRKNGKLPVSGGASNIKAFMEKVDNYSVTTGWNFLFDVFPKLETELNQITKNNFTKNIKYYEQFYLSVLRKVKPFPGVALATTEIEGKLNVVKDLISKSEPAKRRGDLEFYQLERALYMYVRDISQSVEVVAPTSDIQAVFLKKLDSLSAEESIKLIPIRLAGPDPRWAVLLLDLSNNAVKSIYFDPLKLGVIPQALCKELITAFPGIKIESVRSSVEINLSDSGVWLVHAISSYICGSRVSINFLKEFNLIASGIYNELDKAEDRLAKKSVSSACATLINQLNSLETTENMCGFLLDGWDSLEGDIKHLSSIDQQRVYGAVWVFPNNLEPNGVEIEILRDLISQKIKQKQKQDSVYIDAEWLKIYSAINPHIKASRTILPEEIFTKLTELLQTQPVLQKMSAWGAYAHEACNLKCAQLLSLLLEIAKLQGRLDRVRNAQHEGYTLLRAAEAAGASACVKVLTEGFPQDVTPLVLKTGSLFASGSSDDGGPTEQATPNL